LGHVPLSRLVRRRGWPCAVYSGLVNPSSGVFVCWNKISTHECSQSLGRLLGRAAVVVTRYERIERMVPHRVAMFIVVGASKIKAIESSFGDRPKMKRLLRETNDRGYKIVPSAARTYFFPAPVAHFTGAAWLRSVLSRVLLREILLPNWSARCHFPEWVLAVQKCALARGRIVLFVIVVMVDVGSISRLLCLRS